MRMGNLPQDPPTHFRLSTIAPEPYLSRWLCPPISPTSTERGYVSTTNLDDGTLYHMISHTPIGVNPYELPAILVASFRSMGWLSSPSYRLEMSATIEDISLGVNPNVRLVTDVPIS